MSMKTPTWYYPPVIKRGGNSLYTWRFSQKKKKNLSNWWIFQPRWIAGEGNGTTISTCFGMNISLWVLRRICLKIKGTPPNPMIFGHFLKGSISKSCNVGSPGLILGDWHTKDLADGIRTEDLLGWNLLGEALSSFTPWSQDQLLLLQQGHHLPEKHRFIHDSKVSTAALKCKQNQWNCRSDWDLAATADSIYLKLGFGLRNFIK